VSVARSLDRRVDAPGRETLAPVEEAALLVRRPVRVAGVGEQPALSVRRPHAYRARGVAP
jgi:hypothetical protein